MNNSKMMLNVSKFLNLEEVHNYHTLPIILGKDFDDLTIGEIKEFISIRLIPLSSYKKGLNFLFKIVIPNSMKPDAEGIYKTFSSAIVDRIVTDVQITDEYVIVRPEVSDVVDLSGVSLTKLAVHECFCENFTVEVYTEKEHNKMKGKPCASMVGKL